MKKVPKAQAQIEVSRCSKKLRMRSKSGNVILKMIALQHPVAVARQIATNICVCGFLSSEKRS